MLEYFIEMISEMPPMDFLRMMIAVPFMLISGAIMNGATIILSVFTGPAGFMETLSYYSEGIRNLIEFLKLL